MTTIVTRLEHHLLRLALNFGSWRLEVLPRPPALDYEVSLEGRCDKS